LNHPFEKYARQIGNLPQVIGENKKSLKPPPKSLRIHFTNPPSASTQQHIEQRRCKKRCGRSSSLTLSNHGLRGPNDDRIQKASNDGVAGKVQWL